MKYLKAYCENIVNLKGKMTGEEFFKTNLIVCLISFLFLFHFIGIFLYPVVCLILMVGNFSMTIRRLNDIEKSWWNYIWTLIPIIQTIYFLYLCFAKSVDVLNEETEEEKQLRKKLKKAKRKKIIKRVILVVVIILLVLGGLAYGIIRYNEYSSIEFYRNALKYGEFINEKTIVSTDDYYVINGKNVRAEIDTIYILKLKEDNTFTLECKKNLVSNGKIEKQDIFHSNGKLVYIEQDKLWYLDFDYSEIDEIDQNSLLAMKKDYLYDDITIKLPNENYYGVVFTDNI